MSLVVELEGGEVVLRVRDTGIGIEPEMLPRIFGMFVQVKDHKRHAQGGLGIGLGLVRRLVEMHGGSIAALSDGPGTGSEFVVRLPVLTTMPVEEGPPRTSGVRRDSGLVRRRILVVDDNVDAANSLAKYLTRLHGQDVRVAHDGPSALNEAEEFRPEVVVLDIGMPGMDGYEVARQLRSRPETQGASLVAMTGWGQEGDLRRSREAGFDRHLVKPVDPEDLLALLAENGGKAPV
jgi:two-component system CheB/CheR fusion protein